VRHFGYFGWLAPAAKELFPFIYRLCRVEKTVSGEWSGVVCRDQKWNWNMFSPEAGHQITGENELVV